MTRFKQTVKAELLLHKGMIWTTFVLGIIFVAWGFLMAYSDVEGLKAGLSIAPIVAFAFLVGMTLALTMQDFPLLIESGATRKHYFWSEHIVEAIPVFFFSLGLTPMFYLSKLDLFQHILPNHPAQFFITLFLLGVCITGFIKLIPFFIRKENIPRTIVFIILSGLIRFLIPDSTMFFTKVYYLLALKIYFSNFFYLFIRKASSRA